MKNNKTSYKETIKDEILGEVKLKGEIPQQRTLFKILTQAKKLSGKLLLGETGFSSDEERNESAEKIFMKHFPSSSLSSVSSSFRPENAFNDINSSFKPQNHENLENES